MNGSQRLRLCWGPGAKPLALLCFHSIATATTGRNTGKNRNGLSTGPNALLPARTLMTATNKSRIAALLSLLTATTPVLAAPAAKRAPTAPRFALEEATIPALQQAFRDHRITCHTLVQTYLDRIAAYNKAGPKLNAILTP